MSKAIRKTKLTAFIVEGTDKYMSKVIAEFEIAGGKPPKCPLCTKPITTYEDLSIDHIIPRSKGGGDEMENLQIVHKKCNFKKGNKIKSGEEKV